MLAVISHHGTANESLDTLRAQVTQQFQDWHSDLTDVFQQLGYKPKRARREAHDLLARMYGALMIARLHQNPALFMKAMGRLGKQWTDQPETKAP